MAHLLIFALLLGLYIAGVMWATGKLSESFSRAFDKEETDEP